MEAASAEPEEQRHHLDQLQQNLNQRDNQLSELQRQHEEQQKLLNTAQAMLEGQARYLEDVSLREERAAQAIDQLRLLEAEILHYLRHSKPLASLDAQRISRLIQLAKQPPRRADPSLHGSPGQQA